MKKAFSRLTAIDWGEVNPVHAYYNGSCTSKDNEDPSWSTRFQDQENFEGHPSALEALGRTITVKIV
ncbi:hypothetical protein Tco_0612870 [Tanacetum coccineum]